MSIESEEVDDMGMKLKGEEKTPCIEVDDDMGMKSKGKEITSFTSAPLEVDDDMWMKAKEEEFFDKEEEPMSSPDQIRQLEEMIDKMKDDFQKKSELQLAKQQRKYQRLLVKQKELKAKLAQVIISSSSVETNGSSSNKNLIIYAVAAGAVVALLGAAGWYKHRHQQ